MKFFLCFFIALAWCGIARAQSTDLAGALLDRNFSAYKTVKSPQRKINSFKNKTVVQKINPLNYLAAGLLYFYQVILSEQIQAECTYEISCSNYTKLSINKYGFILGTARGIHQLTNCFPGAIEECPAYKVSNNLKIKNHIDLD